MSLSTSVQSSSVNGVERSGCPIPTAPKALVRTTRRTPASRAARCAPSATGRRPRCGCGSPDGWSARAGGRPVTANDVDPRSLAAARANAAANAVEVRLVEGDLLDTDDAYAVVLAGDVFYSRDMAGRVLPYLRRAADRGSLVLVGDPGRAYLPAGLTERAVYDVPVAMSLESVPMRRTTVWQVGR